MRKDKKPLLLGGMLVLALAVSAAAIWFCFAGPETGWVVRAVLLASEAVTLLCAFLLLRLAAKQRKERRAIEKKAYYDRLTGLPNRDRLQEIFSLLPSRGAGYVYLALGLDNFSKISRVFGVELANAAVCEVSAALRHFTEEGELAARLETGEFALLLRVNDPEAFIVRVEGLFRQLNAENVTQAKTAYAYTFVCSGSIYIITGNEKSLENMIEMTNIALHGQARQQSASYGFFDKETLDKLRSYGKLAKEVESALAKGGVFAYFQPKYYLDTGRLSGAELLARWDHPKKGLLMPEEFIPLLELRGKLLEFDLCMLREACTLIRKWIRSGVMPVPLSVNLSKQNIYRTDFVDKMIETVQESGVPPRLIELELTEEQLFDGGRHLAGTMARLRHYGFLLSVTGYGKRYASLQILREGGIDIVKFEAEFFVKPGGYPTQKVRVLAENMLRMMDKLDINVIAEKVETPEQEAFLKKIYCESAQGRLFSQPLPRDQFERLVQLGVPYPKIKR